MNSTTTLVARQYRLNEWAEQIRSCNNRLDNLSVKEWCEQNQITVANYYYRLRQVRKACLEMIPACQELQSIVPVSKAWIASSDSGEHSLKSPVMISR